MNKKNVAFIGLGNMGGPMASNLVKAGYDVRGFDFSASACDVARAAGVTISKSAVEAASGADVVITMLPAGQYVLDVWSNVLPHVSTIAIMIDCSTIDVESALRAHELAGQKGIACLDAPVSGGVGGAKAGTLTFMVGCNDAAFGPAEKVLLSMGKKVFHCGGAGAGQAAKICNNMLLAISMIGVSEALILGEKLGLSHRVMYDVMTASSGRCWSLEAYCPVPGPVPSAPSNHNFAPGFATPLMLKDVRLSQKAAGSVGVSTPLGDMAVSLFAEYEGAGGADKDFSGIIAFLRQKHRAVVEVT